MTSPSRCAENAVLKGDYVGDQAVIKDQESYQFDMPDGHEQQLDDGWTRVSRGKAKEPVYIHGLNPQSRDMTVEKIRADFESKKKRWLNSSCNLQVRQILDRVRPDEGWQIGNAVCLATGSFSRDNWQNRQRSLMQFVAFTAVVQHLQKAQTPKILCYAQEPEYTPVDKEFLASMGLITLPCHKGLDDLGLGAAATYLNASTFVFEPYMDLSVDSMRELFGSGVRLYIGSSLQRWADDSPKADSNDKAETPGSDDSSGEESRAIMRIRTELRQLEQSIRSKRSYKFPRFEEDPNVFEGLRIFWEESEDDDEETSLSEHNSDHLAKV